VNCRFCHTDQLRRDPYFIGDHGNAIVRLMEDQYFEGWTLVILKKHIEEYFELSVDERNRLETVMEHVARAIRAVLRPDHLNYALFGNEVRHVHWHVIPRYEDDGLWGRPPWPHKFKHMRRSEVERLVAALRAAMR